MTGEVSVGPKNSADLWSALVDAAPELGLALATHPGTGAAPEYGDYPGFREWLLVQFALNNPVSLVREQLTAIIEEQNDDGIPTTWPRMGKRQLETARRDLAPLWQPLRRDLEDRIAQIGIANKQSRLLAYQSMIEEVGERMWVERNEKSGQLYLQKTYTDILRAVAEEMGDLGKPADNQLEGLVEIARELVGIIKVQGAGLQDTEVLAEAYDYQTGRTNETEDHEATAVRSEDPDVQEDGLPAES